MLEPAQRDPPRTGTQSMVSPGIDWILVTSSIT